MANTEWYTFFMGFQKSQKITLWYVCKPPPPKHIKMSPKSGQFYLKGHAKWIRSYLEHANACSLPCPVWLIHSTSRARQHVSYGARVDKNMGTPTTSTRAPSSSISDTVSPVLGNQIRFYIRSSDSDLIWSDQIRWGFQLVFLISIWWSQKLFFFFYFSCVDVRFLRIRHIIRLSCCVCFSSLLKKHVSKQLIGTRL